jgi:four helix bundle protein
MANNKESALKNKSYSFAIRMVRLSQYLQQEKKEYILNKQIIRCGTAIGALTREAEFAQSNADYINKFSISLKEANETDYWLALLKDADYIDAKLYDSLAFDCKELISILVSTIKTLKAKNQN